MVRNWKEKLMWYLWKRRWNVRKHIELKKSWTKGKEATKTIGSYTELESRRGKKSNSEDRQGRVETGKALQAVIDN